MTTRNDATRLRISTPEPRRPRAIVARQGLVLLDTYLDQQAVALLDRVEIETRDILDSSGKFLYPAGGTGFRITASGAAANFTIGAGHGYLDGWLIENPAAAKLATQPHPRLNESINAPAIVGLKAMVRFIDPVEDPALADVALGDAQAAGRALNDWQVFPLDISAGGGTLRCAAAADRSEWTKLIAPSTGTMSVIKQAAGPSSDPCSLAPGGGYTRLENLLYRIEVDGGVHKPGMPQADGPRFGLDKLEVKLQRRNASLMARITRIDGNEFMVEPASLDSRHWFAPGSYAEIVSVRDDVDPRAAAANERLFRVALATDDRVMIEATPAAIALTGVAANDQWFLRLWDAFPTGAGVATVSAAGADSQVIDIGDGLSIRFHGGAAATYRRGDYWTFAARANGDIDWPETSPGTPAGMTPHGPETRYAILATMSRGAATAPIVDDCRIPFASLTDRLLFYRGGDGQSLFVPAGGGAPPAGPAFVPLPQRLRVAVMCGQHAVPGALIRWSAPAGAPASRIDGNSLTTTSVTDANGLSEVEWAIDRTKQMSVHSVQATLATSPTTSLANAIVFSATFETAAHSAYVPGQCRHLLGIDNVQDALDTLCARIEPPPVLALTEIKLLPAAGQPVDLIVENLILNGLEVSPDAVVSGIRFGFDGGTLASEIRPWDPVVEVWLDLPYPSTDTDLVYWATASNMPQPGTAAKQVRGQFGFQRLLVDGTVEPVPAQPGRQAGLLWRPSAQAQQFLLTAIRHRFGQKRVQVAAGDFFEVRRDLPPVRILCCLRLRSAHIWTEDPATGERVYLNAKHLGTTEGLTKRELLRGERDPQRAADLDMFIYLQLPGRSLINWDNELVDAMAEATDEATEAIDATEPSQE